MGIVRTAQPSRLPIPGLKVDLYGTSTAYPCGISKDRKTIYGTASALEATLTGTTLYQSVDDGTTWTTVKNFGAGEYVLGIRETDDGEALVHTQATASTPGYVWRSSGWTASHTTATWTKVLTTIGGYIRPRWSGGHTWSFGDDTIRAGTSAVGILSEYGPQTSVTYASGNADTTDLAKARRAYVTTNYGATWTQVLDLSARYQTSTGLHLHASAYDPYWDRMWLSYGDTTVPDGTTKTFVLYSDDRGATWTSVGRPVAWQVGSNAPTLQVTAIGISRDHIYLGADNAPGIYRIPRKGYRVMGDPEHLTEIAGNTGSQVLAMGLHQNPGQPTAPLLLGFTAPGSENTGQLAVSVDTGQSWITAWEDTGLKGAGSKGVQTVYGPTYNGKIVASVGQSSTVTWLLRGELIVPEGGMLDAILTVTGDGATTAFTYAHGLGIKPTRLLAWPERANPISSFTADTTNITVTFTTAPANAAVVPVQLRFAA